MPTVLAATVPTAAAARPTGDDGAVTATLGPPVTPVGPAAAASGAAPVQPVRPRRLALAATAAVLALAAGTALVVRAASRDAVAEALAAHDWTLAEQRAEARLAAHPDDAAAVAQFRQAVHGEALELAGGGRHDDALARLARQRGARPWLDTATWEREVRIAKAAHLVAHQHPEQGGKLFVALREEAPDDPDICRAMLAAFAGRDDAPESLVGAAMVVARQGGGALPADALQVLTAALAREGPFGEGIESLRALLLARAPGIAATVQPWLDGDDYTRRFNAFALLEKAGALGDGDRLRFHLVTLLSYSSSYTVTSEAATWLETESAKPGWAERKAAAHLPAISAAQALRSGDALADRVVALLASAFGEESAVAALAWCADTDQELRWNGYRILAAGHRLERLDVPAFHAATLTTFDPLFSTPAFLAAVTWCTGQRGAPGAAAARQALAAGAQHIGKEVDLYEKSEARFMKQRAAGCREQLARVTAAQAELGR